MTTGRSHIFRRLPMVLAAGLVIAGLSAARADSIALRGDIKHAGAFESFTKDRFHFQPRDGKKLHEMRIRVDSLSLDKPMAVIIKQRGKHDEEDMTLMAYEKPMFVLRKTPGETIELPASRIVSIEKGLDFGGGPWDEGGSAGDTSHTVTAGLESALKTGCVTVVHFHLPSSMSSVRQGNYVGELARQSGGKITASRIVINDWSAPAVAKYDLESLPQFWFFDRKTELVTKLVDRFTEDDIEQALKACGYK